MELVENISTAIDKKQYAVGLFVDLRKAFDKINHSLLLQKLERYGIRGVTLNWIRSYLNNRFQYVKFNNTVSHFRKVTCGVPQGSVLGPKLFILYLNDIGTVLNKLKFIAFVDNTNLFSSGPDIKELLTTVEKELIRLKEWFNINKLSLN